VRSTGDGYWYFTDCLITYTPRGSGARGPRSLSPLQLGLAIALPVVCGVVLLLAGGLVALWAWKRKRSR
jgi:hypothetical protein